MENKILEIKKLLSGKWSGEGYAKFPTIEDTLYTEQWEFEADEHKPAIRFSQKAWYKNETENNRKTVFWDTGFILLNKEQKIILVSAQVGGRVETYHLTSYENGTLTFDSISIDNDEKTIRSQRIITVTETQLEYKMNMNTHQASVFQNHLSASLLRII